MFWFFSVLCHPCRIGLSSLVCLKVLSKTGPPAPQSGDTVLFSPTAWPSVLQSLTSTTQVLSLCCSLGLGYSLAPNTSKKGH